MSGRIFLGPELCRNEEYIHFAVNYTIDMFTAIGKLKKWPWWAKPVGQFFIPELTKISEHRKVAQKIFRPIIRERRKMMQEQKPVPDDIIQAMMNEGKKFGVTDDEIPSLQENFTLVGVQTTVMAVAAV